MEGLIRLPRIGARSLRRWRRSEVKTSRRSLRNYALCSAKNQPSGVHAA